MADEKQIPTGVRVVSVLFYISALYGIIFGLLYFSFGGIIPLGLGILGLFIGRGLWKARYWARIVAMIYAVLGILMLVIFIILGDSRYITRNIFSLVINLFIGGYLLLSSSAREAFA